MFNGIIYRTGRIKNIHKNRKSLFNSIPNLITKSKNIFENKSLNQIDLFGNEEKDEINFLEKIDDWNIDTKLA